MRRNTLWGKDGFFSTQNILVHIPIGAGGYDLSWIEAVGTVAGLLCIWLASLEKISNYAFGLINVTLFAIIFFQIQLYASLLLQLFSLPPISTAGTPGRGKQPPTRQFCKSAGCLYPKL
jgi:nicotinamide riboside transporter PnuC